MKNNYENIDIATFKYLYERYRDFMIPAFIILASFLLFARVVLPSIFDLFDAQEKQKAELQTLGNMKNKLSLLASVDESTLDSQLKTVSSALPIDKDFEAVLNAISESSVKSGVSIASFELLVGSLSDSTEEVEFPTLEVDLAVNGSATAVNDFIGTLNKTLPLSQIINISAAEDLSGIRINFYYKKLARSEPDDNLPLSPVSAQGLSIISELSSDYSIPQSAVFDLASATPSSSTDIRSNPFE